MDLRIGCSGWSYKDWSGPFYPKETQPKDYLTHYSKFANTVEIDSSYYRIPNKSLVASWKRGTPEGFIFTAKLPQDLTKLKVEGLEGKLGFFYSVMNELKPKLGPILVQLPPFIRYKDPALITSFLDFLDPHFRHDSWFNKDVYRLLTDKHVTLCWSTNQYLDTPNEVTDDTIYLRMVGDRSITKFNSVQKDQSSKMSQWSKMIGNVKQAKQGFVFFNNHFAGFGPASVNEFRRIMGMMEVEWSQTQQGPLQGSLSDYQ